MQSPPKNEIRVRLALPTEQRALEELQRRASLNNPGDREALLANPDAIELPLEQITSGQVFVIEALGSVRGFAAILRREDGDAELDALFVEPADWRRGYGAMLVEHCAQAARGCDASMLHVLGNPHAAEFYRRCGFETEGTKETRFGVGLLMCKVL